MLYMRNAYRATTAMVVTATVFFHVATASAQDETGLAACGNIDVSAEAQCEVVAEGGCTAQCEPVSFQAACDGRCEGTCTATAEVDCSGTCQGSCEGECDIDPGQFDCAAECKGSCDGDCQAACEADENSSECQAACKGRCEGDCDADCNVVPPEADCQTKCEAKCDATCTAVANAHCDGVCNVDCVADLQGGCVAQCETPKGALFCDGQYVDTGNNLDDCVAALKAAFDIDVEGYATGEASCSGNECTAQGEAGCSCSVLPRPASSSGPMALGLALAALWGSRRRRTRAR
jgi:MYXO-CTERM domain-containing protein